MDELREIDRLINDALNHLEIAHKQHDYVLNIPIDRHVANNHYSHAIRQLGKAMGIAQADGWIPYSEGDLVEEGWHLITDIGNQSGIIDVDICEYVGNWRNYRDCTVTAYRHLPQPYEVQGE